MPLPVAPVPRPEPCSAGLWAGSRSPRCLQRIPMRLSSRFNRPKSAAFFKRRTQSASAFVRLSAGDGRMPRNLFPNHVALSVCSARPVICTPRAILSAPRIQPNATSPAKQKEPKVPNPQFVLIQRFQTPCPGGRKIPVNLVMPASWRRHGERSGRTSGLTSPSPSAKERPPNTAPPPTLASVATMTPGASAPPAAHRQPASKASGPCTDSRGSPPPRGRLAEEQETKGMRGTDAKSVKNPIGTVMVSFSMGE